MGRFTFKFIAKQMYVYYTYVEIQNIENYIETNA
jgi:hypothetical protein